MRLRSRQPSSERRRFYAQKQRTKAKSREAQKMIIDSEGLETYFEG